MTPHHWKPLRRIGREYCTGCGLLRLHNALTEWCVRHGCDYEEHPLYAAKVRELTARRAP